MMQTFKKYTQAAGALLLVAVLMPACQAQTENQLDARAFQQKIAETPGAVILDVRTPEEFSKGYIAGALNSNWNDDAFNSHVSTIDKSKPVFVYCLSGGRSASAAAKLRGDGFEHVYELTGGMLAWRKANLPEVSRQATSAGMTHTQFLALIDNTNKLVLVDFYADWCAPCRKMDPYLKEIAHDMNETVKVVRIDADANPELCKVLGIQALPVLHLYQQKKLTWSNTGFIDKAGVVKQLQ
ncbi:MAG TPA: thioredoxin domain-containing protein [Cyclobacteriaceae bacterium]|nr:thioredoxin domain-containing protein [Cyclobacteriaceae bacterium]